MQKAAHLSPVTAKGEGAGKAPRHVVEAVRQALANFADEEVVTIAPRRRAVSVTNRSTL